MLRLRSFASRSANQQRGFEAEGGSEGNGDFFGGGGAVGSKERGSYGGGGGGGESEGEGESGDSMDEEGGASFFKEDKATRKVRTLALMTCIQE